MTSDLQAVELAPASTPPPDPHAPQRDPRVDRAAAAIGPLLKAFGERRDFAVRLWDGRGFRAPRGIHPRFTRARLDIHQQLLALPRADGTSDAPPVVDWS
ncbi:MAG: hypothetical protein M3P14_05635 [Chloroflexota bacterium]|nr:hypothetical protein [Chloroflexota bacterium]